MHLYLDTSALVKLYIVEPNADQVFDAIRSATRVCISTVAYVEARSALARRLREGWLSEPELTSALADLDSDWGTFSRLNVTNSLAYRAGSLAQEHGLRGYDAVHLASALDFDRRYGGIAFLGFDDRLNDAARAVSLMLCGEGSDATGDGQGA